MIFARGRGGALLLIIATRERADRTAKFDFAPADLHRRILTRGRPTYVETYGVDRRDRNDGYIDNLPVIIL